MNKEGSEKHQEGIPVPFRLVSISTEEFATFKANYKPEQEDFSIDMDMQLQADAPARLVGIFTRFTFQQNNQAVLMLESACHFELEQSFWDSHNQSNTLSLPKGLVTHLLVLSVGTARGIIHAKRPSWLHGLLLPTLNVTGVIQAENIQIPLESSKE